uniref:Uncharacterized protein n=1 Tax=Tanacetum cinerariifolium TaxID=118510 RepID=A0A699GVL3_TANCI|nr:hypothetical protein [Tanacetum cinerariifolium]
MEMFPFEHYLKGNGDVSLVCFIRENNNNNNKEKTNEDGGDNLDNVKMDGGLLKYCECSKNNHMTRLKIHLLRRSRLIKEHGIKHALFLQLVDERLLLPPKQTPPEADKNSCTRLLMDLLSH